MRKQNKFFFEMESENWTPIEKIILIGWHTITNLRHKHLQAWLLDSDFCQRIVYRYDNTMIPLSMKRGLNYKVKTINIFTTHPEQKSYLHTVHPVHSNIEKPIHQESSQIV